MKSMNAQNENKSRMTLVVLPRLFTRMPHGHYAATRHGLVLHGQRSLMVSRLRKEPNGSHRLFFPQERLRFHFTIFGSPGVVSAGGAPIVVELPLRRRCSTGPSPRPLGISRSSSRARRPRIFSNSEVSTTYSGRASSRR